MNYKRKFRIIGVISLVLIFVTSGIVTMNNLKTNKAKDASVKGLEPAVLKVVIDYDGDLGTLPIGETVKVNLCIENIDDKSHKPAAVRVQLSEYLEYSDEATMNYNFSEDFFVTYSDQTSVDEALASGVDPYATLGGFVRFFETVGENSQKITAEENYEKSYYHLKKDVVDYIGISSEVIKAYDDLKYISKSGDFYYVKAPTLDGPNLDAQAQIDGQFGKPLVLEGKGSESANWISLKTGALPSSWDGSDAEFDDRKTIYYDRELTSNGVISQSNIDESQKSLKFRNYVDLEMNYIFKQAYEDPNVPFEQKKDKWVYEVDENGIPWFYWPDPLEHGFQFKTAPLIKNITLTQEIAPTFYYNYDVKVNGYTHGEDISNLEDAQGKWQIPAFFEQDILLAEDSDGNNNIPYRVLTKKGDYLLVVRKEPITGNVPITLGVNASTDQYYKLPNDKSNFRGITDLWFDETISSQITGGWNTNWAERVSRNSELFSRAVSSDAVTNIGTTSINSDNVLFSSQEGSGFSQPIPVDAENKKVAFPLSVQEASRFCSLERVYMKDNNLSTDKFNNTAESNYNSLVTSTNFCSLRSFSTVGGVTVLYGSGANNLPAIVGVAPREGLPFMVYLSTPAKKFDVHPALWISRFE